MEVSNIISLIEQFGYLALFFCLWLGIVGMPVPDEVIVMTAGLVVSLGILSPIPAFIITFLGVTSGLTIGYTLGKVVGPPILKKFKFKKLNRYIDSSNNLLSKYGSVALIFSYFLPIIRHVLPYLVGINQMSYKKYAAFSYSAGLIWTFIYFELGRYFGQHIDVIANLTYKYAFVFVIVMIALFGIYKFCLRFILGENRNAKETNSNN